MGIHLPVVVATGVVLVVEVSFELDVPVERKRRSPDPLRSAPLIKSTVVEQLAPDGRIHPLLDRSKLLLDRKPAAEPPRVLLVKPG
jgi:hypothetical protein